MRSLLSRAESSHHFRQPGGAVVPTLGPREPKGTRSRQVCPDRTVGKDLVEEPAPTPEPLTTVRADTAHQTGQRHCGANSAPIKDRRVSLKQTWKPPLEACQHLKAKLFMTASALSRLVNRYKGSRRNNECILHTKKPAVPPPSHTLHRSHSREGSWLRLWPRHSGLFWTQSTIENTQE